MTDFFVEFFVAGLSRAQPRAQRGKGGHVIMAKHDDPVLVWRAGVRYEAQRAMAGRTPRTGALFMVVRWLLPRPKNFKGSIDMEIPHESDPDVDNLMKAAMDAIKMVVYGDDNKVTKADVEKRYVAGDEVPGMYMSFRDHKARPWRPALWEIIERLLATR